MRRRAAFSHCRIDAFSSHEAFNNAGRLIRVGDPVAGSAEPTNGGTKSAQLIAWDMRGPSVWKLAPPASVPSYFELNHNALYRLPHLAEDNFVYVRFPKTNFAFLDDPTPVFWPVRSENGEYRRATSCDTWSFRCS